MTAGRRILGLMPMLFGIGGSELERPLAIVMVGGLVTSTLFTLLALPSFYAWVGRPKEAEARDSEGTAPPRSQGIAVMAPTGEAGVAVHEGTGRGNVQDPREPGVGQGLVPGFRREEAVGGRSGGQASPGEAGHELEEELQVDRPGEVGLEALAEDEPAPGRQVLRRSRSAAGDPGHMQHIDAHDDVEARACEPWSVQRAVDIQA